MEESFAVVEGGEKICDNGKEDENLGDHIGILEEMESLLGDIDERLMISRMVSDSLIKGMVNAVEEQAAERIARKELEVVGLKKMLDGFRVASDETKTLWFSVNHCEPHEAAKDQFSDNVVECDRCIMSVDSLQLAINEQLNQLKKEINKIRGPSSIRRISSGSDLVGLSGILQENTPEKWIYVDKAFESLKDTVDAFRRRMEVKDQLSKTLLSEWQQEQEFRSEIEWMVISNGIWGLQQEFEQKLWGRYDSESRNCFNQYKEISSLRQELDSIFKMLSVAETGHLISHGSLENTEEWCHNKRADHFHVKLSTDHSPSTTEENGKQEESKINKPENLDSASLKHMSKEELVTYITKMRRNHESQERDMTEENFRLRRELLNLKERGSSFPLKKDKEFELLKKKIPGVISKLNKILDGNEKIHQFSENIESLSNLKGILDFLHFENHQLKDMLADKKKESTNLSSQLSAAEKKLSQQQITEKNLLQTIQKLEDDDIGDAHTQVSVIQDIYKCFFEDIVSEFRCITEELHLKNSFMQEIYEVIIKEASHSAEASSGLGIEEADMESTMMQGLLDINHIIFKETLVNADEALKLEVAENRKLKYEMLMLKLVVDPTKGNLVAALEEIKQYKERMHQLHQNLEQRNNKLRETDEERRVLCALIQKQQEALKLIEAKERENRKQMESTINLIHKLLTMVTDFEARVNKDISRNCLRLQNMRSEFHWINNKANVLKTMGLVYKQRLETRSSDLAKAEAEVDVLGDEVDTLLSLLEKIYIALDHYSPILQHYPGIIEILELVRRELSGEARKLV